MDLKDLECLLQNIKDSDWLKSKLKFELGNSDSDLQLKQFVG